MVVVGTGGMTVAGDITEIDAKGQNAILTTVVHIAGVGITVSIISRKRLGKERNSGGSSGSGSGTGSSGRKKRKY